AQRHAGPVLGLIGGCARGPEDGHSRRKFGELAESFDELALDAQHAPRVGVHPLGRSARVKQALIGGAALDLRAPTNDWSGQLLVPLLWARRIRRHGPNLAAEATLIEPTGSQMCR